VDTPKFIDKDTDSSQDKLPEPLEFTGTQKTDRRNADFISNKKYVQNYTLFPIDESYFTPSLPRTTHWSVAWSDLMMTMFILFLVMYVYQLANEDFLQHKEPEIIGGDTTEALESIDESGAAFPFAPIHPGIPLMTSGTIKKVESVESDAPASDSAATVKTREQQLSEIQKEIYPDNLAFILPKDENEIPAPELVSSSQPAEDILEPLPLNHTQPGQVAQNKFQEIFTMSQNTLDSNNLDKFAAIDIIPDKTMRIILTSDLLFALGESEMSYNAEGALKKITTAIQSTPYMINIVGHTDNIPMRSYQYKSNWELSVARASTVARFLIDEMSMNPQQFVVSGYSSYRPLRPNTTAANRAKNRRVEIIISKRLPMPLAPTAKNLR